MTLNGSRVFSDGIVMARNELQLNYRGPLNPVKFLWQKGTHTKKKVIKKNNKKKKVI